MGDEVFQLKPTLYGFGIDLKAAWRRIWGKGPTGPEAVSVRFMQLFEAHGVQISQIPRLAPEIGLHNLVSPAALLPGLSNQVLDSACSLFGVRREWLEGRDERMYEIRYSYKQPIRFFREFNSLRHPTEMVPVRAIATDKQLDSKSGRSQRIELVMVEQVASFGDEVIERYAPLSDGRDWAYEDHRLELKAIVRAYGSPVPLYQCSRDEIERLYHGSVVPRSLMRGSLLTEPSLEDFCMSRNENWHAKELEELKRVIEAAHELRVEVSKIGSGGTQDA